MPWLTADDPFPELAGRHALGIAARLVQHDSGLHRHPWGQILYTRSGCISVTLDTQLCLLPPGRLIWIPAGLPHQARMSRHVDYRSVYLDPAHYPGLPAQVQILGAGQKTISRLFKRDTGLTYQQWRQQWRLLKAIEQLATGLSVTRVASGLGFASDSAFIAFFKDQIGVTPGQYIRQRDDSMEAGGEKRQTGAPTVLRSSKDS